MNRRPHRTVSGRSRPKTVANQLFPGKHRPRASRSMPIQMRCMTIAPRHPRANDQRKRPANADLFWYRGAEIRTRDLTDPNGARYQAAPRPDARAVSHTTRRPGALSVRAAVPAADRRDPRRARPAARAGALRGLLRQRPAGARAGAVQTIATGVSANAELFELAAREQAELLLVHHGLFWGAGVAVDRRAAQAPPADPVRRGHRARRLPPAARRASASSATTRCSRAALGAARARAVRPAPRPADRLHRELPRRRAARGGAVRARARGHRSASRSCSTRDRSACARVAIVSGAGADYIAEAARPAPTRCSRASRPSARWRRRARRACT